jgi:hypothetical protein
MLQRVVCVTGAKVDQRLCAWLAVLVLPVNSALNPVIYTLTTSFFKNQVRRIPTAFLLTLAHYVTLTGITSWYPHTQFPPRERAQRDDRYVNRILKEVSSNGAASRTRH